MPPLVLNTNLNIMEELLTSDLGELTSITALGACGYNHQSRPILC